MSRRFLKSSGKNKQQFGRDVFEVDNLASMVTHDHVSRKSSHKNKQTNNVLAKLSKAENPNRISSTVGVAFRQVGIETHSAAGGPK